MKEIGLRGGHVSLAPPWVHKCLGLVDQALHLIMMMVKTVQTKTINKSIYKKKLKNKNFNLLLIPPASFGPCPCNVP